MRRPLAVVGFGYLIGAGVTLVAVQLSASHLSAVVIACLGLAVFAGACLWKKSGKMRRRAVAVFSLSLCLSACAVLLSTVLRDQPMASLSGQEATVTGTISALETTEIRSTLELRVEKISSDALPSAVSSVKDVRLRLYCYEQQDFQLRDQLTCQVQFYDNDSSALLRLRGQGLDQSGSIQELTALRQRGEDEPFFTRIRRNLSNGISRILPLEEGEMVKEMTLDAGQLSQDLTDSFRRAGTSHLLAISGLHLSLISELLFLLLNSLFRRKRREGGPACELLPASITIVFILFYMALTSWGVGVVRAGITLIVCHLGMLFGRRGDGLNSLGLAALILLLPDPRTVLDLSFLLSFSATLGLVVLSSPLTVWFYCRIQRFFRWIRIWRLTRLFQRAARYLSASFGVSCAASLLTLPFVLLSFGSFPLIAPLSNLFSLPLAPFIIAGGMLCGLLAQLPLLLPVAKAAGFVAGTASKILIWITEKFSELPFASLPASYRFVAIWIVGSLLLLGMVFGIRRFRIYRRRCVLWCIVTLLAGILSYQLTMQSTGQLLFLRLGNSCVTVALEGQSCVVAASELSVYQAQSLARELSSRGVLRCRLFICLGDNARTDNALAAFVRMLPTDRMALSSSGGQLQPVVQRLSDPEIFSLDELPVSFSVGDSLQVYLAEQELLFVRLCGQTVAYYTGRGNSQEIRELFNVVNVASLSFSDVLA